MAAAAPTRGLGAMAAASGGYWGRGGGGEEEEQEQEEEEERKRVVGRGRMGGMRGAGRDACGEVGGRQDERRDVGVRVWEAGGSRGGSGEAGGGCWLLRYGSGWSG
ncbi:hypothetical protein I4F81_011394 [Pyropia yezoensis]|uniref:Uncharacterized protein n=1 Tax=Pyropia yezoensis TaxID=2788 RepID=A0ACC3CFE0_PYRYE|nr:hypothetical protein I4F81_011394 [Neopyropia yezoensis]